MNIKNYLWLFPFCSFILGYMLTHYFFYSESITTPDIMGKYVHEALPILSHYHLNTQVIKQKEDNILPEGIIVYQTPQAGKIIKQNQSIFIVTTKKLSAIPMPTCIEKDINTLLPQLHSIGLYPTIYKLAHHYPENMCFAQTPNQTDSIEHKKLILYISAQINKPIIWPSFMNMSLQSVIEFLDAYDIKPYIINDSSNVHISEHAIIIEQRPLAGTLINLDNKSPLHVHLRIQ